MTPLHPLISLSVLVWALPLVFLIHDGEEILAMSRWIRANRARLEQRNWIHKLLTRAADIPRPKFIVAVAFIFAIVVTVTLVSIPLLRQGRHLDMFTVAVTMLLLNAFTHIGYSLIVRGYTPGVATAVLVLLPYCYYTLHRLLISGQNGLVAGGHVIGFAVIALCVVIATAHIFSRIMVR
jgi:Protein of unknown function with HXXEE motif